MKIISYLKYSNNLRAHLWRGREALSRRKLRELPAGKGICRKWISNTSDQFVISLSRSSVKSIAGTVFVNVSHKTTVIFALLQSLTDHLPRRRLLMSQSSLLNKQSDSFKRPESAGRLSFELAYAFSSVHNIAAHRGKDGGGGVLHRQIHMFPLTLRFRNPLARKFDTRCSLYFYLAPPGKWLHRRIILLGRLFFPPSLTAHHYFFRRLLYCCFLIIPLCPLFTSLFWYGWKNSRGGSSRSAFTLSIELLSDPPFISELLRERANERARGRSGTLTRVKCVVMS